MNLQLYLIRETKEARLYRRGKGPNDPTIWIPFSVIKSQTKFGDIDGQGFKRCEVVVEDWFANKNKL